MSDSIKKYEELKEEGKLSKFKRINEITIVSPNDDIYGIGIIFDKEKRIVIPCKDWNDVRKSLTKWKNKIENTNYEKNR